MAQNKAKTINKKYQSYIKGFIKQREMNFKPLFKEKREELYQYKIHKNYKVIM